MKKFKDAAGISMMEMVLFVGIMTLIGAGVFRLYAEASERARRAEIQSNIPEVIRQVNLLYSGRAIGSTGLAVGTNANTNNYLTNRNVRLVHPWSTANDAITVTWRGPVTGVITRPFIEVQVRHMPRASCIWLVSAMVGTGLCTSAGTATAQTPTVAICNPAPEVAATQCSATNNTNIVYVRSPKE